MAGTGKAHLRYDHDDVVLRVEDLVVEFKSSGGQRVHAVSGISFDVLEGETLGFVGESGCGKSTTGRSIMQLPPPTSGSVVLQGVDLATLDDNALRRTRTSLQMIFQDPISSLNPRRTVRELVAEGLRIWGNTTALRDTVDATLVSVGLDPDVVGDRRPNQLSGGQCQRVCIARALIMGPKVVICDEPVSALDVSVQAQILNLLEDMKALYGITLIFIAHDLAVVKNISDRIVVMYLGKICEVAGADDLYAHPAHPYTQILIDAIPEPDPTVGLAPTTMVGEPPSPVEPPSGCRFRTRCPRATQLCSDTEPQLRLIGDGRFVACHHPSE